MKENTEMRENKNINIFQEEDGCYSMRRVLACVLTMASVVNMVLSLTNQAEWHIVACAGIIPLAGALILLFFTTWADIAGLVSSIKRIN